MRPESHPFDEASRGFAMNNAVLFSYKVMRETAVLSRAVEATEELD